MDPVKIAAFAGSARKGSFNARLARAAAEAAGAAGADATFIDLADYPLPLFNQDLEAEHGLPDPGRRLKDQLLDQHGFLICSPEYNSSISPLMKNTIDWLSRPTDSEPGLVCFQGKVVGLLATSPGRLGGLRGLVHLRSIMMNIGCHVVPKQLAVPSAFEAFGEDGGITDPKMQSGVEGVAAAVVDLARRLGDG